MELEKVIKDRCSIRRFTDELVNPDKLQRILTAGRLAPTAKNNQPQRVYVIQSEEGLQKLDKATRCRYHSRTVLLVCSNIDEAWSDEKGYSSFEMDAVISATHMMLEATNLGVDNIWIMLFDKEIIKKEFNLPDNIKPICLLPLGYRKDIGPSPLHDKRKSEEEIVTYI